MHICLALRLGGVRHAGGGMRAHGGRFERNRRVEREIPQAFDPYSDLYLMSMRARCSEGTGSGTTAARRQLGLQAGSRAACVLAAYAVLRPPTGRRAASGIRLMRGKEGPVDAIVAARRLAEAGSTSTGPARCHALPRARVAGRGGGQSRRRARICCSCSLLGGRA